MNIGITSASDFNPYASTLLSELIMKSYMPVCVICVGRSQAYEAVRYLKVQGAPKTLRKALERYGLAEPSQNDGRYFLSEYAARHRWPDWNTPLSVFCKKRGIEYLSVSDINSPIIVEYAKRKPIDLLLNAGGGIFRAPILEAVRGGVLNAHMGYLPLFRGINVLEWSLFYGHNIGVTVHFIDQGIDTGDILLFKEIPIQKGDTISTLRAKSSVINVGLMAECVEGLGHNKMERKSQAVSSGKQYFVMHDRLKKITERKLKEIQGV